MERIEKQPVDLNGKAILVTGAAGFIGNNLCKRLLRVTTESVIVGIDCMTDYNPIELKEWRLKDIQETFEQDGIARKNQWIFVKGDIADQALITKMFNQYAFVVVVNLAAQAGVRYSITNPEAYLHSNLIGFFNILEACRNDKNLEHLYTLPVPLCTAEIRRFHSAPMTKSTTRYRFTQRPRKAMS